MKIKSCGWSISDAIFTCDYKDEVRKAFSKDIKRAIKLTEKAISDPKPDDGEYTNEMYKGEEYAATYKPHSSNFNNLTVLDNDGNTIFRIYQHVEFPEIEIPVKDAKDKSYLEEIYHQIMDNVGNWLNLDLSGNAFITQAGGIHFYATGGQGDPKVISESAVEHIDVTDLLISLGVTKTFGIGKLPQNGIRKFIENIHEFANSSTEAYKESSNTESSSKIEKREAIDRSKGNGQFSVGFRRVENGVYETYLIK